MSRTVCLAVLLSACASSPPPRVDLGGPWPERPSDYEATHERWTRHDGYSADWTRVIDVYATLESAEWRAAYARERAHRLKLGPQAEAELMAQQRAAVDGPIEVVMLVLTTKPEWNELDKGKESIWRLALADAEGHEVEPLTVREDRRPRAEIKSWYPDFQPFYTAYVVSFPQKTADGRTLLDSKKLSLKVGGGLGTVEVAWSE